MRNKILCKRITSLPLINILVIISEVLPQQIIKKKILSKKNNQCKHKPFKKQITSLFFIVLLIIPEELAAETADDLCLLGAQTYPA